MKPPSFAFGSFDPSGKSWLELSGAAHECERVRHFGKAAQLYARAHILAPQRPEVALGLVRNLLLDGKSGQATAVHDALLGTLRLEVESLHQLFSIQLVLNRSHTALETILTLETLGQDVGPLLSQLAIAAAHQCSWTVRDQAVKQLLVRARAGGSCAINLFPIFSTIDDPAVHRDFAAMISRLVKREHRRVATNARKQRHGRARTAMSRRIRVAYLGGNFSRHATTMLITGIIEHHDRERFETTLIDYSIEDGSDARARILRAFDKVESLGNAGPRAAAERIERHKPDILIDVHGYTDRTRSEILAYRPAPIQINFLGYVGTQAADWCDYVIADRTVIPETERRFWQENVIYMPNSYYPNDRSRPLTTPVLGQARTAQGLPDGAFVFACFNNLYKVTAEIFAIWMKILREAPESVLWLLNSNLFAKERLLAEASALGVSPSRLIFCEPTGLSAHIQRHLCADLFLDTYPYSAHTTGADCLWAGLPLLSLFGRSFASRVATSQLIAVGLPQLACKSSDEYIETALSYYRNPKELLGVIEVLNLARTHSPLFDAQLYTKHLELGLAQAIRQARRDIFVSDFGS